MGYTLQLDGSPLPPVDPEDVARVWSLLSAERSVSVPLNGAPGYNVRLLAQVCKPDSDVYAVFFRTTLPQLLSKQNKLNNWQGDGGRVRPQVFEFVATYRLPDGLAALDVDAFISALKERLS